ncbi:hypothetical protein M0804_002491 [Polistes exclamans]|nr:hypothetical protein M0804_002491 [Polistes exclamans]
MEEGRGEGQIWDSAIAVIGPPTERKTVSTRSLSTSVSSNSNNNSSSSSSSSSRGNKGVAKEGNLQAISMRA